VRPENEAPLHRLIETVSSAGVDAVAFTSAPAAVSFLHAADQQGRGGDVRVALRGPVVAACVGPITAGPLLNENIPVIQPSRGRLGALVRIVLTVVKRGYRLAFEPERAGNRGGS
jgi:uroporphyrinogen-III synthase